MDNIKEAILGKVKRTLKPLNIPEPKLDSAMQKVRRAQKRVQASVDEGYSTMGASAAVWVAMETLPTQISSAVDHFNNGENQAGVSSLFLAFAPIAPVLGAMASQPVVGLLVGSFISLIGMIVSATLPREKSMLEQFEQLIRHIHAKDKENYAKAIQRIYETLIDEFAVVEDDSLSWGDLHARFSMVNGDEALELGNIEAWLNEDENQTNLQDFGDVMLAFSHAFELRVLLSIAAIGKLTDEYKPEGVAVVRSILNHARPSFERIFKVNQIVGNYYRIGENKWLYQASRNNRDEATSWNKLGGELKQLYITPDKQRFFILMGNYLHSGFGHVNDCSQVKANKNYGTNPVVFDVTPGMKSMAGYGERNLLIQLNNDSTHREELHCCVYDPVTNSITSKSKQEQIPFFAVNSQGVAALVEYYHGLNTVNLWLGPLHCNQLPKINGSNVASTDIVVGDWYKVKFVVPNPHEKIHGIAVGENGVFVQVSSHEFRYNTLPPYKNKHVPEWKTLSFPGYDIKGFSISRDNSLMFVTTSDSIHYARLSKDNEASGDPVGWEVDSTLFYKSPAVGAGAVFRDLKAMDHYLESIVVTTVKVPYTETPLIRMVSAMPHTETAPGTQSMQEWITVQNLGTTVATLSGLTLSDSHGNSVDLTKVESSNKDNLRNGESMTIYDLGGILVSTSGGPITLQSKGKILQTIRIPMPLKEGHAVILG